MANIYFTFEVEGRAIFVARESLAGSLTRFIDPKSDFRAFLSTLHDDQGSIAPTDATLSARQSTPYEIEKFATRSAETCRAGRAEREDILDGYPIFLIDCIDPTFPDQDINTGLPVVVPPRTSRALGTAIGGSCAMNSGPAPRSAPAA